MLLTNDLLDMEAALANEEQFTSGFKKWGRSHPPEPLGISNGFTLHI